MKKNILFIMADQLRYDYLGCNGHPFIQTPNIDALAAMGVNFTNAFCQSAVCGPSRMSFYTGRYVFTHGGTWNNIPIRVDEYTMGDFLRPLGYRVGLVGKTHFQRDAEGMKKLGISLESDLGILVSESGFEPWERDDGLHPDQSVAPDLAYNMYLWEKGYKGENPWHSIANSALGEHDELLTGWAMRNVDKPARVDKAHSETAYMTDRAMEVIKSLGDASWCLHLSYIKPHWPYMAPAPYHKMYSKKDIIPPIRCSDEIKTRHPVVDAYAAHEESINFSKDVCRERVIPSYMGLISELDANIGRLVEFLKSEKKFDDTIIVITSDHGDYLGDHWLGEKELFYESAIKIPMIIIDPSHSASSTRGKNVDHFVESIDLIPTFMEMAGSPTTPDHILEGKSLVPLLYGNLEESWRDAVFCEMDYSIRHARNTLSKPVDKCRAYMVRDKRWKYVYFNGFDPQLFDLEKDPKELNDLGNDPKYKEIREDMFRKLFEWMSQRQIRKTLSKDEIASRTGSSKKRGYLFGVW